MTLAVAVGSARHAPGVSTLTMLLALAWSSGRRVVLGADPDGCDLAARYGLGVEPGLVSLAMDTRRSTTRVDIDGHGRPLTADVSVIPGPVAAEEAGSVLALAGQAIADTAAADRHRTWFVDVGRVGARSVSTVFAARAMTTLVVVRGCAEELLPVPARVEALKRAGCHVGVVTVGRSGYSMAEIGEFVGCEIYGELPDDPNAGGLVAEVLAGRRVRSRLWPAVVELALKLEVVCQPRLVDGVVS